MKTHEVIKLLIKNKGLNQKELCKKVGISQTAMSFILTGKTEPKTETLEKISEAVEVPIAIIKYLTLEEKDIPEHKKEIFKMLNPSMEAFIKEIFEI